MSSQEAEQDPIPLHVTTTGNSSSLDSTRNVTDAKSLEAISNQLVAVDGFLKGWRLHLLSVCVALLILLVNIEVSIVGTSLVTITNSLHGVDKTGWVITGYLITYTGTIIIWAKLSDIFGRKVAAIATLFIFAAFSGVCGAAQTMNQLIICRVFQGIGAAGCWSLGLTIAYEMVPKEKYALQAAQTAGATALGSLAGPFIGGGSSQSGQWRWAFLFNVPAGAATIILLFIVLPSNFPYQGDPEAAPPTWHQRLSKHSIARLDVAGAFLLLGATMLLVAVLLEGGISIAWNSAAAIVLFIISGIMWILFMGNEWYFTQKEHTLEPIFPWRFIRNRAWMGTLLISMCSGIPYNIIVIDVPQRFQAVAQASPLGAAVRLLPFNALLAVSSVLINIIADKSQILPIWLILVGSLIQLAGLIWFCTLPQDATIPSTEYACQVLTGVGIGCVMGILLQIPPRVVEKRDLAISSGALVQFRVFGGVLGLSICTTAFNNYLTSHLSEDFKNLPASDILRSVQEAHSFPPNVQQQILKSLAGAYNLQMEILVGFAALQILLTGMMYRPNNQIRVVEKRPTNGNTTSHVDEEKS